MTTLQIPPRNVPFLNPTGTVANIWYDFLAAVVDRAGGILGGLQPEDDTLTALAGLDTSAGLVVEASADTFTKRTLTGTAARITITNGSGAAGNPTVDLATVAGVAGTYSPLTSVTFDAYGRATAAS